MVHLTYSLLHILSTSGEMNLALWTHLIPCVERRPQKKYVLLQLTCGVLLLPFLFLFVVRASFSCSTSVNFSEVRRALKWAHTNLMLRAETSAANCIQALLCLLPSFHKFFLIQKHKNFYLNRSSSLSVVQIFTSLDLKRKKEKPSSLCLLCRQLIMAVSSLHLLRDCGGWKFWGAAETANYIKPPCCSRCAEARRDLLPVVLLLLKIRAEQHSAHYVAFCKPLRWLPVNAQQS